MIFSYLKNHATVPMKIMNVIFASKKKLSSTGELQCIFSCILDQKKIDTLPQKGASDCLNGEEFYRAAIGYRLIDGDGCINNGTTMNGFIQCKFPNMITSTTTQQSSNSATSSSSSALSSSQMNVVNVSMETLLDNAEPNKVLSGWDILLLITCIAGLTVLISCAVITRSKSRIPYTRVNMDENNAITQQDEDKSDVFDSSEGVVELDEMKSEDKEEVI